MCVEEAKKIVSEAKIILLDIEGTTTSISFVKDKLFPYAAIHLENYVKTNWNEEQMKQIVTSLVNNQDTLKDKKGFIALPPVPSETAKVEFFEKVISHLKWQQANDFKSTGLKTLQGYIWMNGYQKKEVEGHVYDDVPEALKTWKKEGKKIFIYSSGSVAAQKLLFKYSKFGDLDSVILLLGVCCLMAFGDYSVCIPGVCRRTRCPKIAPCNENQTFIKRATHCKCCGVCVPLLNIGDACLRIKRGPVTGKCKSGLRCINRRCSLSRSHNHRTDDKHPK